VGVGLVTPDPAQYNAQFGSQVAGGVPGDYSDATSVANISTQPDPSAFVSTNVSRIARDLRAS
jgi:hypothetical protein